jgi:DNA-binding FrmR family transcriptional regulator
MRDQDAYCEKLTTHLASVKSELEVLRREIARLEARNKRVKLAAAVADMHNEKLEQQLDYYKDRGLELMAKNTQLKSAIDELNRIRGF